MLTDGLYEQVINDAINAELAKTSRHYETTPIDTAEAPKVLAKYVSEITERALENLHDQHFDLADQIDLVNQLVRTVLQATQDAGAQHADAHHTDAQHTDTHHAGVPRSQSIAQPGQQLLALYDKTNSVLALDEKARIVRPETSIAQTNLFTGAIHEPQMYTELKKEILSCSRIDMLVSFVKWSGLRLIIDELRTFAQNGGELRVITTSYMGATDVKAIDEIRKLPGAKIKVSYDTKRTRLHAKAYVFYRETGFTTAYVGSSNLSNAAISSGLEWNVKVAAKDLPQTIDKIAATFESYWNSKEFEYYDEGQHDRLARALKAEKYFESNSADLYTVDVLPYYYQEEILDKLAAERSIRGYNRNLVVAATGTGKTVVSALDYKRFVRQNPKSPCRLLFVAHREEILKQSRSTFRAVLKDANFGELFVGGFRPNSVDYLFMSIQTFNSQDFTSKTSPDYYDYIVVDEFHHAAAPTYQRLLEYYQPKILLGLTATPERMDGQSVLKYFNDRIAAEIRLPEAIDRKLLSPFQYFGVTDTVNLSHVKWLAGSYDRGELSRIYTASPADAVRRADLIISSLLKYVTDIDDVKGLGFCVTKAHARYMCDYFNDHNIPSLCLTGESHEDVRANAKNELVAGAIRFIFVVDIYNEGVDIPEVNTILFLRPTESLTIFLQQLGRGLRLAEGKECLTVLDFIGQANKRYNFESKFEALLANTNHSVTQEIKNGFVAAPKGCYIQLEKMASKYILDNIRSSYGDSGWLVTKIASFEEDTGLVLNLANFLSYYRIDPRSVYKCASFSRLCARADVRGDFEDPMEDMLTKSMGRLAVANSRRWIAYLLEAIPRFGNLDAAALPDVEKRMLRMLAITIWAKKSESWDDGEVLANLQSLEASSVLMSELIELLKYQFDQIDFIDEPVDVGFDCPLDLHCSYTRDQLMVALDFMKPSTVREGVKRLEDKKLDVFLITLNKSDKEYSPTTMYNDYSISETLFHWQSQSTTSADSPTGLRYINHKERGSRVLLFVREFKKDSVLAGAAAYTYLGTANYVSHEGSRPMNVTWELDRPIPAKYLKKTNKLVVG